MTEQSPLPEEVSDFYDVYTHVLLRAWGDNFHYGYGEPAGAGLPGRYLHLAGEAELGDQAVAARRPAGRWPTRPPGAGSPARRHRRPPDS
ncbi:MAG: hypothetical protein ACRDNF_24090 [Streptosporangiaceae bacterium]